MTPPRATRADLDARVEADVSGRRPRSTVSRLLTLPVVFAAVVWPMVWAGVPPYPGLVLASVAGTVLAAAVLRARSSRRVVAIGSAYAAGVLLGWATNDPCTLMGLQIGPLVGWVIDHLIHRGL